MKEIILASKSPRRKELLKLIFDKFEIEDSSVHEAYDEHLSNEEIVLYLSKIKASAVFQKYSDKLIIAADTIVVYKNQILGKPSDKNDAYRMLKMLSGKTHQVITGVTILSDSINESFYSKTNVSFYELSDTEIFEYINSTEPYDKAGGYGIQGKAAKYIKEINGDYFTVVGLPVGMLYQRFKDQF